MPWRARLRGGAAWLAVPVAFVTSVTLHALWDGTTEQWEHAALALVGYGLLTWRLAVAGPVPSKRPQPACRGSGPIVKRRGRAGGAA